VAAVERPCGLITLDGNVEAGNRNAPFIEAKAVDKKRTRGQMRLPEVAARLRVLATDLNCDELNDLADEIARRPSGQRAPRTSARMTAELRNRILEMKEGDPDLSHAEIGRRLNLNPGRVSKTIRGKRS
jgi:hypothetical protein